MRAFVTGGTGFVGTHLVQQLSAAGWDLTILCRSTSDTTQIRNLPRVTFTLGDITDKGSLSTAIPEHADAVFHVAGSVENLPHHKEHIRYKINQEGTKNVVQVCETKKIGRLIYTSTVVTYDFHACRPLTEDAPPNEWCRDSYTHSKRLAENEVESAYKKGLDVVFLHPSAMFGSQDKGAWSKMFLEIERGLPLPFAPPGGGSVCYVRDVAKAHIAAFHKGTKGRHYLLGGPDVTWLEVAQSIAHILNKPAPLAALPASVFRIYGTLEHLISTHILKREPMLTPHIINMLSEHIYSVSDRAHRELGYTPSSLDEMLYDCFYWMVETGRLEARRSERDILSRVP